jgi:biopolymer transport protein ExbB
VLAGGISEALVTTEMGLVIAIPVMILHGLLSEKNRKNHQRTLRAKHLAYE